MNDSFNFFNLAENKKDENFEEFENLIHFYLNDQNQKIIKIFLLKESQHWKGSYLSAGIIHHEWQKWYILCEKFILTV